MDSTAAPGENCEERPAWRPEENGLRISDLSVGSEKSLSTSNIDAGSHD